jgi:hypothetical protein
MYNVSKVKDDKQDSSLGERMLCHGVQKSPKTGKEEEKNVD